MFYTFAQYKCFLPTLSLKTNTGHQVVLIIPKQYRISWFLTPTFSCIVAPAWGCSWTTTKGVRYAPDVIGWVDRLSAGYLDQTSDSYRREIWRSYADWYWIKCDHGKRKKPKVFQQIKISHRSTVQRLLGFLQLVWTSTTRICSLRLLMFALGEYPPQRLNMLELLYCAMGLNHSCQDEPVPQQSPMRYH